MNGWSDEQKEQLLEASRNLHELAVLWAHASGEPESPPVEPTEAPLNRLIHVEPEAQEEEEDKSTARALHRRLSGGPLHGGHEVTQSARGRVPRKATDLPDFPELVEWLHRATTRLL